jgi:Phage gp6-like head-tail connector protein
VATGDLTSVANVKGWLNIATSTDDTLIARLVTAISQYAQTWMNRQIATQSYSEKRTGTGSDALALANFPCTAVSSLVIAGQPVTASPDGVQAGYVFDDRFIYLVGNAFASSAFPSAAPNKFPKWPPLGVQIGYTAGFAATPPELEQAVIEWVSLRYQERARIGMSSKSMAGETTAFIVKDMPDSVKTVLSNYRKVIPV